MKSNEYRHHVSYIANNNVVGCITIINNTEKYELTHQVDYLTEHIKSLLNLKSLIITNIISFEVFF